MGLPTDRAALLAEFDQAAVGVEILDASAQGAAAPAGSLDVRLE